MKQYTIVLGAAAILFLTTSVWAEVQNVQVGGDLRIRGLYLSPSISPDNPNGPHLVEKKSTD